MPWTVTGWSRRSSVFCARSKKRLVSLCSFLHFTTPHSLSPSLCLSLSLSLPLYASVRSQKWCISGSFAAGNCIPGTGRILDGPCGGLVLILYWSYRAEHWFIYLFRPLGSRVSSQSPKSVPCWGIMQNRLYISCKENGLRLLQCYYFVQNVD